MEEPRNKQGAGSTEPASNFDDKASSIPQVPATPPFTFPLDETKRKILEILEKIRQCNISQDIDAPELVMCGKQSSGKSSVLEAITGLEFPKGDGGPCTRFVIEIRLFPDEKESYIKSKVRFRSTVQNSKDGRDEAKEKELGKHTEITQIIAEANKVMGISKEKKFSPYVLSIEYHFLDPRPSIGDPGLTLIDLPGLTAVGDTDFLEQVTRRYVENDTALILAVVDAVNDPETHEILKIAQEFDPDCLRTFGIITKPDMTSPSSELENAWVQEILNPATSRWFKMGSHVLLNRSSHQIKQDTHHKTLNDRDEREREFFGDQTRLAPNSQELGNSKKMKNGWFKLYSTRSWGVANLRERLISLLSDAAVRQIDSIYNSIQAGLQRRKKEIDEHEEKDPKKQRREVDNIIYTLRNLAYQASSGNYTQKGFFTISRDGPEWLRSKIVDHGTVFAEKMRSEGHNSGVFRWKPDEKLPNDPKSKEVSQMLDLLRRTQSGLHPGEFNTDRVQLLFQEYSDPWNTLATSYVETCHGCCVNFASHALRYSIRDADLVQRFMMHEIRGKLEERKKNALAALELIEEDRGEAFLSMNPSMWMGNRELMGEMVKTLADDLKIQVPSKQSTPLKGNASPGKLGTQAKEEFDELERVSRVNALKILHNMMIMYKKCRETYIDNITNRFIFSKKLDGILDIIQQLRCNLKLFSLLLRQICRWLWSTSSHERELLLNAIQSTRQQCTHRQIWICSPTYHLQLEHGFCDATKRCFLVFPSPANVFASAPDTCRHALVTII
ncbi:hypothetical protein BDZ45DRAFT_147486 [Acephala macrosclerotiorum]|nr:hypothetical protein BDZ45DRAFT_147486 [Acephala macrosclerotiorum]